MSQFNVEYEVILTYTTGATTLRSAYSHGEAQTTAKALAKHWNAKEVNIYRKERFHSLRVLPVARG